LLTAGGRHWEREGGEMSIHKNTLVRVMVLLGSVFSAVSCMTTKASFEISVDPRRSNMMLKKIVVLPWNPIQGIVKDDLLDGEQELSAFTVSIFQSPVCQVIGIAQVRKDIGMLPTTRLDQNTLLIKILTQYNPDGVFWCTFSNLEERSGGAYSGVEGTISGGVTIQLMGFQPDAKVVNLVKISGLSKVGTGSIFAPKFATFVQYTLKDLEPQLRLAMDQSR
jgi:hypothetical protein